MDQSRDIGLDVELPCAVFVNNRQCSNPTNRARIFKFWQVPDMAGAWAMMPICTDCYRDFVGRLDGK